jgi:probable DNA repair protein
LRQSFSVSLISPDRLGFLQWRVSNLFESLTTIAFERALALPNESLVVLSPSDRARRAYAGLWAQLRVAQDTTPSVIATTLPRFLTLKGWLANLWTEGQLFGRISDSRKLIEPAVEAALWRHFAAEIANVGSAESVALASACAEAWMLEHGYRDLVSQRTPIAPTTSGDLYRSIRRQFTDALEARGAITSAELPGALVTQAEAIASLLPSVVLQTPSFAPIPAEQLVLTRLCEVHATSEHYVLDVSDSLGDNFTRAHERRLFDDARAEQTAAIEWANTHTHSLSAATPFVRLLAIVVPDLRQTRGQWQRAMRETKLPFNISLGLAVSAYPWAAAGFTLAGALTQSEAPERIAQALRHPRWGYSDSLLRAIGIREQALLETDVASTTLPDFLNDNVLSTSLDALSIRALAQSARGKKSRAQWRNVFAQLINVLTVRDTSLDSEVFQLREALAQSIDAWQALDDWLPVISIAAAQRELIAITDEAAFQPEGSDAPIQVMGLLESAGVPFDAVWITGMSERVLPEAARSNPFLAIEWQRMQRTGLAQIDECDARAGRLVDGWRRCGELIASLPHSVDDEPQLWSPLVLDWKLRELLAEAATDDATTEDSIVKVHDETAPAWQPVRSVGTRALESQALCPRRGFADSRLRLRAWPAPEDGLSPRLRGELVHAVAERIGRARIGELFDDATVTQQLYEIVSASVYAVQATRPDVPRYVWNAECDRLQRVFLKLLTEESKRPNFTTLDVEKKVETQINGLEFSMRVDRIDQLESGTDELRHLAVIDFKSGSQINVKGLSDERLTAPQLPLYARAVGADHVDAVVFARVSDDHQDFVGRGAEGTGFAAKPRLKNNGAHETQDWQSLRNSWPEKLERIANELLAGDAVLAPAYGQQTCKKCDYQRFCRVDLQALAQGEAEQDGITEQGANA